MKIREKYYDKMSMLIISVIGAILLFKITLTPTPIIGEISTYMLPTISIEQRMSLFVNQSDIDKAVKDFPDVFRNIKTFDDLPASKLVVVEKNKWISYYFPTYSIAALPIKLFLKAIRVNQSATFLLTNLLFYILALLVVYYKLKAPRKNVFLIILLLICSPIIFYTKTWSSAESFIFSLVVMSLTFFSNKEYKKAGILVSIAGSLNPTIMIYGAMIIVSYFIDIYNNAEERNFLIVIKKKITDIIVFGFCFIPSLIPFIFNYIVLGKLVYNGQSLITNEIGQRFFAYLFDFNLGFFPFVPIVLIVFIILITIGIYKRNIQSILYFISFFGTVLSYSLIFHINCGMTGISRYDSWSLPIMIFFILTVGVTFIKKDFLNKVFTVLIYLSSLISMAIIITFSKMPDRIHYTFNNPIATTVLNNIPQLYNPFYATFISRTEHIDGGYIYTKPVIYTDNDDNNAIRKIMVTSDTINELQDMVKGDSESLEIFRKKVDEIRDKKGYNYINFSRNANCKLFVSDEEDRGEVIEDIDLYDEKEININSQINNMFVFSIPIDIEPNTVYKIQFGSDAPKEVQSFFVDLYGNKGAYDNVAQEKHLILSKGTNKYKIFLNSGDCKNVQNGCLRIICSGNVQMKLNNIHVAKMKDAK